MQPGAGAGEEGPCPHECPGASALQDRARVLGPGTAGWGPRALQSPWRWVGRKGERCFYGKADSAQSFAALIESKSRDSSEAGLAVRAV